MWKALHSLRVRKSCHNARNMNFYAFVDSMETANIVNTPQKLRTQTRIEHIRPTSRGSLSGDRKSHFSDVDDVDDGEFQWDAFNLNELESPQFLNDATRHSRLGASKSAQSPRQDIDGKSIGSQKSLGSISSILRQQLERDHKKGV